MRRAVENEQRLMSVRSLLSAATCRLIEQRERTFVLMHQGRDASMANRLLESFERSVAMLTATYDLLERTQNLMVTTRIQSELAAARLAARLH